MRKKIFLIFSSFSLIMFFMAFLAIITLSSIQAYNQPLNGYMPKVNWCTREGEPIDGFDPTNAYCWIGPNGTEGFYNINVETTVKVMRNLGFDAKTYPYWVREDGVKMLGNYVICTAFDSKSHPRGSTITGALGTYIVCDYGNPETAGAYNTPAEQYVEIATYW